MKKKDLNPGKPFADLLGKLVRVPKHELDVELRREQRRKEKRRKK